MITIVRGALCDVCKTVNGEMKDVREIVGSGEGKKGSWNDEGARDGRGGEARMSDSRRGRRCEKKAGASESNKESETKVEKNGRKQTKAARREGLPEVMGQMDDAMLAQARSIRERMHRVIDRCISTRDDVTRAMVFAALDLHLAAFFITFGAVLQPKAPLLMLSD